ncbi:MAG: S1 RNA-binding domain-containing protein [Anaerolineaceae bacterium]|nr:S1 RNA-binding domain-containing protein [Anaerolineaceae bacterium]
MDQGGEETAKAETEGGGEAAPVVDQASTVDEESEGGGEMASVVDQAGTVDAESEDGGETAPVVYQASTVDEESEDGGETASVVYQAGTVDEEGQGGGEMADLAMEDWDYQRPRRGEVRDGTILAIRDQEIIVDVGAKRDGIVPYADLQRMDPEAIQQLKVGDSVPVYVLRPEDQEGNLLVSLYLARQSAAWKRAQELAESGEVWEAEVEGYNKGGLVVPIGEVRGFIPASQIPGFPMGMSQEDRLARLSKLVGEKLHVKVIEINRRKRRLILSAQAAQKQWRQRQRERLLEELREGEVRKGMVSSLASFGAFVDLGGADGLVHLSELSWRRVRHPKEVVKVGQEVEVFVLRLDEERNRIALSLKRLEPEPWALVEDKYELGQLVEGVVTNVVDFGAFAEIDEGIEGLIHVSELADAPISHPKEVVKKGDLLLLRIIRIDARRKRLGLSLKRVLEAEWAEWAARLAPPREEEAQAAEPEEPSEVEGQEEEMAVSAAPAGEEEITPVAVSDDQAEVEVPEAEAEVEAPEVEAEVEVPEAEAEVEAPEVEAEAEVLAAEAEVDAPEVEAEVEVPEAEVEVPEAEAEVEAPEVEAEVVEAETEPDDLEETDEEPEFAVV